MRTGTLCKRYRNLLLIVLIAGSLIFFCAGNLYASVKIDDLELKVEKVGKESQKKCLYTARFGFFIKNVSNKTIYISYNRIKYYLGRTKQLSKPITQINPPSTVEDDESAVTWVLVDESFYVHPPRMDKVKPKGKYKAGGAGTATLEKGSQSFFHLFFLVEPSGYDWIGFTSEVGVNEGVVAKDRWQIQKFEELDCASDDAAGSK
jgi:hypothetical protein